MDFVEASSSSSSSSYAEIDTRFQNYFPPLGLLGVVMNIRSKKSNLSLDIKA
jgi:hypothetical protein